MVESVVETPQFLILRQKKVEPVNDRFQMRLLGVERNQT